MPNGLTETSLRSRAGVTRRAACLLPTASDETLVAMASSAEIPTADELVNVNLSCADGWDPQDGSSSSRVCSDGSLCLDGDLGVYCQCYESMFTGEEVGTVCGPGQAAFLLGFIRLFGSRSRSSVVAAPENSLANNDCR